LAKLARRRPEGSIRIGATSPAGHLTVPASRSISNSRLAIRRPLTGASGTGASTSTSRTASSARTGPGAVGGVAEQPPGAARLGPAVNQALGLGAALLAGRRHLDRRDQGLDGVARRRLQLVAVEALVLGLAPVAHLGVVHRQDAVGAGAAVKPRDAILLDVEVLADQLVSSLNRLLLEEPLGRSTARSARSASSATRVSVRSRSACSRQRQSGLSAGFA
jgi:hypothetical protein